MSLPASTSVVDLCHHLSELAGDVARNKSWPKQSIDACCKAGVFRWFIPEQYGGWGWSEQQILAGYLALSQSCLTTTFVLTQWHAACRRILASPNKKLIECVAPKLASGETFTTVGISHLTTSRQHTEPVLRATRHGDGFRLDGFSPWVTGAVNADLLVLGATLVEEADHSQILVAVPTNASGVRLYPGQDLIALSASCTDRVDLDAVQVSRGDVLFGPAPNVMQLSSEASSASGGLQTSVLAVGLASAATNFIRQHAQLRPSLQIISDKLGRDVRELTRTLEQLTNGSEVCTSTDLRQRANSLVLRATQAALQTAKGTGFVEGHPAGRWAQEALFFLVWSCPQAVVDANLCELAGL